MGEGKESGSIEGSGGAQHEGPRKKLRPGVCVLNSFFLQNDPRISVFHGHRLIDTSTPWSQKETRRG